MGEVTRASLDSILSRDSTEDIKAALSGSCDAGEYGVVEQGRIVPLPSNERKPVE